MTDIADDKVINSGYVGMTPSNEIITGAKECLVDDDITKRLLNACNGWPNTTISWPHRLLHEARGEIEKLRTALLAKGVEVAKLEAAEKELEHYRSQEYPRLSVVNNNLTKALNNARGILNYIAVQAIAGHSGFNKVAEMNAKNAMNKIDEALNMGEK